VVDDFGSNVICYGLRTDFQSHLFEGSRRLFEIADTIDENQNPPATAAIRPSLMLALMPMVTL